MKRMFCLSFFLAGYSCLFAFSPVSDSQASTDLLQQYLEYLVAHHPELNEINHKQLALGDMQDEAMGLPDPQLGVGIFLEPIETRVGPQRQKVSIMQGLPWHKKRSLKKEVMQSEIEALGAMKKSLSLKLVSDFKKQYAKLFFLGQSLSTNRDHLAILDNLENVLLTKYQTGLTSYANVVRIQLEKDRLKDRIAGLEAQHRPLSAGILFSLGLSFPFAQDNVWAETQFPNGLVPLPANLPDQKGSSPDINVNLHPSLMVIEARKQAAKTELTLEQQVKLPDFKVNLDWIQTDGARMPGVAGSGNDAIAIGFSMNLPVWKNRNHSQQAATAQMIEAQDEQWFQQKNNLSQQLQKALFDRDEADRKIKLYSEQILPKANETLSVILTAFESDTASYLDILDAERALLEFSLQLQNAYSDLFIAQAELEALGG